MSPMDLALIAAAVGLLITLLLLMVLLVLHKVRRAYLKMFELSARVTSAADNLFQQISALQALHQDLRLNQHLPPTRGWAASPDFLLAISAHSLSNRPKIVIECSSGVSTIVLARCLQIVGQGHVYSLEHDACYVEKNRALLAKYGVSEWATIVHAPLVPLQIQGRKFMWYSLDGLPPIDKLDLLIVDGPPESGGTGARYPAGPLLVSRLATRGAVFVDDSNRDEEKEMIRLWQKEIPDLTVETVECEKGCTVLLRGHDGA